MTDELKPCPFCGKEAEESFAGGGNIACSNNDCQAGMLMLYPNIWNTRPIEDKLRAELAAMDAHVSEWQACIAARDALIERLVEAGDRVIADYVEMTKWTGSIDVVQGWRILVAECRAMKGGEG